MSDPQVHEFLALAAIFIGTTQFGLRWQWGKYLGAENGQSAMEAWAICGAITCGAVAATQLQYRNYPINVNDYWPLLYPLAVIAIHYWAVWRTYKAIKDWADTTNIPHRETERRTEFQGKKNRRR